MYEFFFAKIMGIQLNTHEYILGPPLSAGTGTTRLMDRRDSGPYILYTSQTLDI
jgi:hypothetical protein